ncbi:universal stress protein [Maribacter sp. CXY002]|uniref:universal stress protein n=1 Tax=Maribacter luteocoastalis TaxID=3407671 RepID=UPI003B67C973
MRTVLIPTDFSANAVHAINYALKLFDSEKISFYFLHAYADEVYGPSINQKGYSIEQLKEKVKTSSDNLLQELIHTLKENTSNPKHSFNTLSVFDSLVDAVNDLVNEKNVDLVIMGTQGKTKDKNITFGSHTVQVFKYVKCPVLAVPESFQFKKPKKIVFPTDYLLPYKKRELKLLDSLASMFTSEVHLLYISDFEDLCQRQIDNQGFIKELLPHAELFFERTPVKNKAEAIMEYIIMKNIDFLVMVNSRHSFLEDMLYRSTVDQIGLKIKVPFLVLQNLHR